MSAMLAQVDTRPAARPSGAKAKPFITRAQGVALAAFFLRTLETQRLHVVLMAADDPRHCGHSIRVVDESNPDWYREFCGLYESARKDLWKWRKFKTAIKRRETVNALENIVRLESLGYKATGLYVGRLKDFIRQHGHKWLEWI